MMRVKMIGNNKKGGLFGILFLIMFLLISFFLVFLMIEEMRYSWKVNKEMNDNNATCYLERGLFRIPVAKICTYNNTIIVEKRQMGNNSQQKSLRRKDNGNK